MIHNPPQALPLVDVAPELIGELRTLLLAEGYTALAAQTAELRLYDRCRCGDDFCGSFDTSLRPWPTRGPDDFTLPLSGELIIDVIEAKIVQVEVISRDDIRTKVHKALP